MFNGLKRFDYYNIDMGHKNKTKERTVVILSGEAANLYTESRSDKYKEFVQSIQERLPQDPPYTDLFETQVTDFMGNIKGGEFTGVGCYISVSELTIVEVTLIWSSESDQNPEKWSKWAGTARDIIDDMFGSDPEFDHLSDWNEYIDYSHDHPERFVFE